MSVEKKIKYKDQRLTKAQQKKAKPANQGGGPNYLGKEKTVTVPKRWLSSPDHVVAELAYITPREQKILLDADLYGSLKGKPNKGPGGIMSLQGDLGGYDASPGGPNDGGSKGSSTESKSKQRAADIMTGKTNVSSPTGVTEGYTGPGPVGRNKAGDFVGPGYKGDIGGFDEDGNFVEGLGLTSTNKGFNWKGALFNIGLMAINPALAAKYGKVKTAYNTVNKIGELANTFGLTNTNVVDNFTDNLKGSFTGFNTTSKGPKGPPDNKEGGNGGNEQNALLSEYLLLLQRMEKGLLSAEEQGRFNSLKSRLGKAEGGIMDVNMNKGRLGETLYG